MKILLLTLFVGVTTVTSRATDTNTAPQTEIRLQSIVHQADSSATNAPTVVTTNSPATTTNAPRYQQRLQTIIRRGTNQPVQMPATNSQ